LEVKMEKERICCVCRLKAPASERIRIAREKKPDGGYKYFVDRVGNANGRGCYLCSSCIDTAIKKKAINRSFKAQVCQEIYDELINIQKSLQ